MADYGSQRKGSALEQYAESLQGSSEEEAATMLFPMYTVPVEALLQMTDSEPHELLKAKEVVVEFSSTMGNAVFVSHQWVGEHHPDPEFKQLRVLQDAIRHMFSNLQHIPLDMFTETLVPSAKTLSTSQLRAAPLFVWYDYFSCPQLLVGSSELSKAIDSIPAYVARSRFFFALCPVVLNPRLHSVFTPSSWTARGWCRAEKVCRELSEDHSWVMIKSSTELELISSPAAFPGGSAGEGLFTVEADRGKLAHVLQGVLRRRLRYLLKARDFVGFRLLQNMQAAHLRGFSVQIDRDLVPGFQEDPGAPSRSVQNFLFQNGFAKVKQLDRAGWTPLHYAALSGDADLIRDLLEQNANVNGWTKKDQPLVGAPKGTSAIQICAFLKHHTATRMLISARANVFAAGLMAEEAVIAAALANDPEGIRILCRAGCSPVKRNRLGMHAFDVAAANGARLALEELVLQAGPSTHAADLSNTLSWALSFRGGTSDMVKRLLDLNADVNYMNVSPALPVVFVLMTVKTLQHRFGKKTLMSRWVFHLKHQTPLMSAVISGQYEGAAALIAAGARLDLRNARNWTAADFARKQSIPDFLSQALQGQPEQCEQVYSLSLAAEDFEV